jgi:hypothetical protein
MTIINDFIKALYGLVISDKENIPPQKAETPQPVKDPKDKDSTNLFVGKILEDRILKCEVVDVHKTNIHVKILDIYWDRMGTYLDVGKTYPVFLHSYDMNNQDMQVWEISPKHMKRSTSQVILQWEKDIGWCWDLDF